MPGPAPATSLDADRRSEAFGKGLRIGDGCRRRVVIGGINDGARRDEGHGVPCTGVTSDDVDHEREKLSAGSGSARSAVGLDLIAAAFGGAPVSRMIRVAPGCRPGSAGPVRRRTP